MNIQQASEKLKEHLQAFSKDEITANLFYSEVATLQVELDKLAKEPKATLEITEEHIRYRADIMEIKITEEQIKQALELIENDMYLWDSIAESEINAIEQVTQD